MEEGGRATRGEALLHLQHRVRERRRVVPHAERRRADARDERRRKDRRGTQARAVRQPRPQVNRQAAARRVPGEHDAVRRYPPPLHVELDVRERLARQVAPPVGRERRGGACATC